MQIQCSCFLQVLSQLKKFARAFKQVKDAVQKRPERGRRQPGGADDSSDPFGRSRMPKSDPNMSLSELLRTDITGMDATVTGTHLPFIQKARQHKFSLLHHSGDVQCEKWLS